MPIVLLAFAATATLGAGPADAELAPIVRFMALTKLALALCTAGAVVARYAPYRSPGSSRSLRSLRPRRLVAGLAAALCMACAAGMIWSAVSFAGAFALFLSGAAIAALLVIGELGASLRRRP